MDNQIYNKLKRKGWSGNESVREQFEEFSNNEVDEELYGKQNNKRQGKRKKIVDKPYKIFCRYVNKTSYWYRKEKGWHQYYVGPFSSKNNRDHELEKLNRGWGHNYYEFCPVDNEEEEKRLLEENNDNQ